MWYGQRMDNCVDAGDWLWSAACAAPWVPNRLDSGEGTVPERTLTSLLQDLGSACYSKGTCSVDNEPTTVVVAPLIPYDGPSDVHVFDHDSGLQIARYYYDEGYSAEMQAWYGERRDECLGISLIPWDGCRVISIRTR